MKTSWKVRFLVTSENAAWLGAFDRVGNLRFSASPKTLFEARALAETLKANTNVQKISIDRIERSLVDRWVRKES